MEAAEAAGPDGGDPVTAPVAEPSLSELGRLGEYELLAKLGVGGMGTVYKARQTRLGKIVALKVLASERTRDPRAVARFENEMKAVGQLSHSNIVQAYDARDIDGTTVLVMEYVDGVDLSKLVQRAGPLPIADACELVRQTAIGLQYIHENHLVHRDIKPSNLMLTPQGQVKILDLGLALLGSEQTPGKEVTSNGLAMGTPDYIAPEQADDSHRVNIRADIYSLGCTFYHLLTGRAPFSGPNYKTPLNKVVGHARDTVPTAKTLRASVPDELSRIVERMMAKNPAARFATPAEAAAALAPFAAGCDLAGLFTDSALPGQSPTDAGLIRLPLASSPPWWRRRSTRIAAAAALPLLVVSGITLYVATNKGTLLLTVNVPDAVIKINGERVEIKTPRDGLSLNVGDHKIEVSKDGFETYTESFEIRRGGSKELSAVLIKSFPPATPGGQSYPPRVGEAVAFQLTGILPAVDCNTVDVSPDGTKIYVGEWDHPRFRVFDAVSRTGIRDYASRGCRGGNLVSGDGNYLWYSDFYAGTVNKVNLTTGKVDKSIKVGPWPGNLAFDSRRRYLYVGQNVPGRGSVGSLRVVDMTTESMIGSGVTLNGEPNFPICVSPDDQYVYIASRNSGSERLYKIRSTDQSVINTLDVVGCNSTLSGEHRDCGFSLSPDGSKVYMPYRTAGRIDVIDTGTMSVVDHIRVSNPGGVWAFPDGTRALVVSASGIMEARFQFLDLSNKSVLQTLSVTGLKQLDAHGDLDSKKPYFSSSNGIVNAIYVPLDAEDGGGVAILVPAPASTPTPSTRQSGYSWQTVYHTDFSTDPEWTTNDPSHFYWNQSSCTYHFYNDKKSDEYAYTTLSYSDSASYKLEYDIELIRCDWAACSSLGLFDTQMAEKSQTNWQVQFARVDAGRSAFLLYWNPLRRCLPSQEQAAPFAAMCGTTCRRSMTTMLER